MTCTAIAQACRCTDQATPKRLSFPSLSPNPRYMQAVANPGWRKRVRGGPEEYFFEWIFNMDTNNTSSGQQDSEARMISANISWADELEVATIGPWRSVVDGTEAGEYLLFHKEMETHSLYQWLGLELHGAQQGASELFYLDRVVHADRMEDTCGTPVTGDTILNVGGELMAVSVIAADEPINWPAG